VSGKGGDDDDREADDDDDGTRTALKHGKLELPEHLALEIPRVEPVPIGELVAAITDGVRRVLGPDATIHALWQTSTFEVPSGKGTLVWWLVLDRTLLELKSGDHSCRERPQTCNHGTGSWSSAVPARLEHDHLHLR